MQTERERLAIEKYEKEGHQGIIDTTPLWVDSFSSAIFHELGGEGRVIDIGCGHGRFIQLLDGLGIDPDNYLGIDPSPAQIELAKRLHPGLDFRVENIYSLGETFPEQFDGFWCACVLMHLPREKLPQALRSLRASLRKGAVGLVSTPFGTGEREAESGLTLTLYELEELEDAFWDARLSSYFVSPDQNMALGSILAI